MFRNKIFYFLVIWGLGSFLFFYKLGNLPLLDPDEPRYAEVAREMAETKDLLIPHFNYEIRLKKPPLFYWLIFISFKIFGINEFSARFPSALSALGGVILTYLIGANLFAPFSGFLSSLILVTSLEYLILSRLAITDMVLCFFFLSSIFSFIKYTKGKKKIFLYFFWISLALSFLTKGPVGLLPLLVIFVFSLYTRDFSLFKELFTGSISAFLIFLFLSLFWYLLLIFKFGSSEMLNLFYEETLERFLKGYIHREPLFYFLPILLIGFFPWTVFLPWLNRVSLHQKLLLIWWGVVFTFFSLSRSKVPTYVISLFPCLSIILGSFWNEVFSQRIKYLGRKLSFSMVFLFLSMIFLWGGAKIFLQKKYGLMLPREAVYPLIFSLMIFLFFVFKRKPLFVFMSALSLSLFSLIFFYRLFAVDLGNLRSTRALIFSLKEKIKKEDILIAYRFSKPSLVFYSQHKIIFLQNQEELLNYLGKKDKRIWILTDTPGVE
ncbi:MAG: glycosyltransferase family 39 protein [Candidatus Omnitrophica bacterium]|nr:glycosyltransferase family 39 protein [Candidatus Omnitrophota bacterium]MCM8793213.1 glycosyltransferase family 39 protein [Candidatus Omnitrophota bacterium]